MGGRSAFGGRLFGCGAVDPAGVWSTVSAGGAFRQIAPQIVDDLGQGTAFDQLHGVEMDAPLAPHEMDRHDVRGAASGRRLGPRSEPLQPLRIEHRGVGEDFQGDRAVQRQLDRFVDHAHAAPADFAADFEVAQAARDRPGRFAHHALDCGRPGSTHRREERGHAAEIVRQFRIRGGVLLDIHRLAPLQPLHDHFRDSSHERAVAGRVRKKILGLFGHGIGPCRRKGVLVAGPSTGKARQSLLHQNPVQAD